ncbi:hypothetical protein A2U01_0044412 [Trifolium medium]|uniref:Uncharacterized protein n=1 Tax=Trifolium medium TaxID=97028 RepID=A0A392QH82_9FABA|nr:hypothetical protein [Trifolium medium]
MNQRERNNRETERRGKEGERLTVAVGWRTAAIPCNGEGGCGYDGCRGAV